MTTVALEDRYAKYLSLFGDEQQVAQEAIYEYLQRKAGERVARIVVEQAELEAQYGMDLKTLQQRVAADEEYLESLNRTQPLWEEDLAHWNYVSEELEEWRQIERTLSEREDDLQEFPDVA